MKSKKRITIYPFGPIEFANSEAINWRKELAAFLENSAISASFEFIDPIEASYKIGADVSENAVYAAKVKAVQDWPSFDDFMDNIWAQDKVNVDSSDVLVSWAQTEDDLVKLSYSGGSWREIERAISRLQPVFVITRGPFVKVSSHFLHMFRLHGKAIGHESIVKSPYDFCEELRRHFDL
ncbi:MAG: hypothetical protein Q8Q39_02660 [bacterium]|nr:hypothetical protein [bacterium]